MNQEISRRDERNIKMDISFVIRCLWKNIFIIITCSLITGAAVFVGLEFSMHSTYTVSVDLAMIARENSAARWTENSLNAAVSRNLNVLNSEMLKEQIKRNENSKKIQGKVSAFRIPDTNIITLSASADSGEGALRLLQAALKAYPTLTGYFESGYIMRELFRPTAAEIREQPPETLYYAVLSGISVLAAGIGVTVLVCLSTDRIHSREQAAALLEIPILGTLHFMRKKRTQKAILVSAADADSVYVEEIDKLATCIQEKMKKENLKTLMVNSIRENEGKSTIAANLALNFVQRGKRVVLIDTDMRRPAVAKIFDRLVEKGTGLSDYLDGTSSLQKLMYADKTRKNLKFIFQDRAVSNPDKLLEGQTFRQLLDGISSYVDLIILDTAPIGIVRDAEIIAAVADAAVLVIRQDGVRAAEVNDVVDVLDDTGTSVLGGILNMARGENGRMGRRGRYGRYYYGYENRK